MDNDIALTISAAKRYGIQLTRDQAEQHSKIIRKRVSEDGDEYGQNFWDAAKEYFLN
ncbi:MAG TPA: hypothetical protein VE977_13805 [Pyrinomonadaceae bacterium]|nr:hypothetical protein [Pyrinomonadaceae bacterium]